MQIEFGQYHKYSLLYFTYNTSEKVKITPYKVKLPTHSLCGMLYLL